MKVAVIFYHKNVLKIYQPEWIAQCIQSIEAQTFKDFDVFELNYGSDDQRFCKGFFFQLPLENHIAAMNHLITLAFSMGYDVVFNTNMDDFYHPTRFEKQLLKISQGYQLVSSNFRYFGEKELEMNMKKYGDIGANLMMGHNVIAHPVVAYHHSFWDDDLHYRNLLGYEDLDLWQRAYAKGKKFFIINECLLYYRIHSGQITKQYGINGKKKSQFIARRNG